MSLIHIKILFQLVIVRMIGWNLTHSFMNMGILTPFKNCLDFVNISASVISVRLLISYNDPGLGLLCQTDTFLVLSLFQGPMGERGAPGPEGTRGAPVSYISLFLLVFHFHFIKKDIFIFPLCPQS